VNETNQVTIVPPETQEQPTNPKAPEVRLILACQAEGLQSRYSELNSEDSGLTALGWEQTNSLARWIAAHEKVDLLVSAPQLRSRLTAQRLGQVLGKAVVIVPDLPSHSRTGIEQSSERHHLFAPLHASEQFNSPAAHLQFKTKLADALQHILNEHWGKTICVVLDGNAIATALTIFTNGSNFAYSINHTALSEIAWQGGEWCIVYVNRLEHRLAPALPTAALATATAEAAQAEKDDEDTTSILNVYNRILSTDTDLEDQTVDQRFLHFLKFAALPSGLRVLDLGTGTGRLALLAAEEGAREVVGVDVSPAMLEIAEYFRLSSPSPKAKQVSFRLASVQRMPFRSESFDAVLCRLVVHHSSKPERILQEILRLLKPGGILVFADLVGPDDPVKRATQNTIESRRNPSHAAALSAEQYRKLLTTSGFTIEGETVAVFEQDLEEWLSELGSLPANRSVVREMMEAGLETDAAGLNVRRQSGKLIFDRRLIYLKATKPT